MKRIVAIILCLMVSFACMAASAQSGSWGQINQPVGRPDDWQAFVQSSPFALGEKVQAGEANGAAIYQYQWGSYPSLDGSTVCVPMAMELGRQLLGMREEDLKGFVAFSTTHYAYERLIKSAANPTVTIPSENAMMDGTHPVDIILATEPSADELKMAEDAGVTLVKVPFCYDAFVFLVNARNPVNDLSLEQIRGIYTGAVRNWSAVGGADEQIIPFQREPNSGSQTAMENLVMKGTPLSGAVENYVSEGMGELVSQIGSYDNGWNSIGYSYLYYIENLYKSGELKVLSVDGITPSAENLRTGKYLFAACYYAVYRQGDEAAAAFANWLQGEEGQRCVAQAGYIPYVAP